MMQQQYGRRLRAPGFTLIEIVIVMAIIAILAAVAIPSYRGSIQKAERATARAILMENAQYMERHYAANDTYVGGAVLSAVSPKNTTLTKVRYNISFSAGPAANSFTLQAVPVNAQSTDSCGTLTLSNTGAQTGATTGCW